ncbi:MAG: hypothetical protein Q4F54_04770 [Coriobacteriia bacterium]|nr:hypothetical protein [Coriobacteriia bacterium]
MSAKAVYDPKALTFSFYYDCDSHSDDISRGCTVYPVDGNCGFSAGQYGIRSTERNEESKRLSNDKLSALDYATNFTIDALDDLRRPGIMDYRLSGLTLPSWYMIDYNNYKIVNLLKGASKIDVNFTESFQYCPYIYSTSCWFMADSDGYAPFKFDLAYFGRIPTQNIRQTACMFGGFSFEMFKPQNY